MNFRKSHKLMSLALVLALLLGLIPPGTALGFISARNYGWTLGLWNPTTQKIEPANTSTVFWNSMWCWTIGPWDVRLNGTTVGTIIQFTDKNRPRDNGYPMVGEPQWDDWIALANGNRDYVHQVLLSQSSELVPPVGKTYFASFSQLIQLCGGAGVSYDVANHYINIVTTVPPYVTLLADRTQVSVGDTVTFTLKAQTNTYYNQFLDLSFWSESGPIISSQRYYQKHVEVTKTVTMNKPGTFKFTLIATDSVMRTTQKSIYIGVGETPPPPPPDEPPPPDTPPPPPPNQPPVAYFTWPATAYEGETVTVTDQSSDPDGTIVSRSWAIAPSSGAALNLGSSGGTVTFSTYGTYELFLTVRDDDGAQANCSRTIAVKQPIPWASLNVSGTLKANRKVVIDWSGSGSPALYPLDPAKDELVIEPLSGGTSSDIKLGTRTGRVQEVLFKQPGMYRVKVRVYNAKYASAWAVQDIVIEPDDPSVANFTPSLYVLRDPGDSVAGRAYATIKLADRSYSPDSDVITQRIWKYRFDSNNDGSFLDETWTVLDAGNSTAPALRTDRVGKYQFELEVKESFGQPTIPQFVTDADCRRSDTSAKPLNTKTSEVVNVPPDTSFTASIKPKIDIVFSVEQISPARTSSLEEKINGLVLPKISGRADVKVTIADHTQPVSTADYYQNYPAADGRYVVYNDERVSGSKCIYVYDTATKQERLIQYPNYTQYNVEMYNRPKVWNGRLVFTDYTKTYPYTYRVNYYDLSTNTHRVVTTSPYSMTSDIYGDYIVYGKYNAALKVAEVYLYTISTGATRKLANGSGPQIWGSRVVYQRDLSTNGSPSWQRDLFMYDISANREYTVSAAPWWVESYDIWDDYVVYADFRNDGRQTGGGGFSGTTDVYMYRISEGKEYVISAIPGESECSVSVCDGKIAWTQEWSQYQMYVYDINKKIKTPVTFGLWRTDYSAVGGSLVVWQDWRDYSVGSSRWDLYMFVFTPTVNNVSWRDGSRKVLVVLNDNYLLDLWSNTASQFADTLKTAGISYYVLGSATNRSDAESIISLNSNNGAFIDNTDLDSALNTLGDSLAASLNSQSGEAGRYVLLGESIALLPHYSDYENDPKYADNWYYVHDPNYVDNNSGYSFYHNKVLASPVDVLDKVGKYDITYKAQDNPVNGDLRFLDYMLWSNPLPTSIIVHRKPVADFTVQPGTLNITDLSYDPDFQYRRPDKGVVEWEWKWKPASSGTWTLGSPNGITTPGTYDVYLRVQDCYGAWSDPVTKTITVTDPNRPPVAVFTWTPAVIYEGDDVTLTNQSYDPDGDPMTYQWTVFDPLGVIRTYTTRNVTLTNVLPGTWWVTLRAWDNHGATGVVTKSFVVNQLGVTGYVQHTPDWNNHRIAYNQYLTGTDNVPRGYNLFWAGERFILKADTTDTGSSATKAVTVTATLLNNGITSTLTSGDKVTWTGDMWQPDFERLPDGAYTFRFRVTYSNGVIKTDDVAITISGSWQDYFRYHRGE